ncbi:hypothetical protein SVIO_107920 [Streptomyces violaceusniger]|uniref:Uncharacterized protein n=1 Tax=Streptomyces violaceusniger TaxID=68280 RepID=A0A4D4LQN2_STRVO|nr:hypothetical protein SVIO_107920 [Streptomyces violaceusniger]
MSTPATSPLFGPANNRGAQVGRFTGIRTLYPLLATSSAPTARPVIAAVRLPQGKSADPRGAERTPPATRVRSSIPTPAGAVTA